MTLFGFTLGPWGALALAGLLEVAWASGFKFIGPQRPFISAVVVAAMIASFYFLWVATQRLPIGTAYAVWTGIGAVGTAIVGIVLLGESANMMRVLSILLIAIGILGLKLAPHS